MSKEMLYKCEENGGNEMKVLFKNETPKSISFAEGFLGSRGNVGFRMVYDSEKAIKFIKENSDKIDYVVAGLVGDWNFNSSTIYENEEFEDYNCYDNSIWAKPSIRVFYKDGNNVTYECWKAHE